MTDTKKRPAVPAPPIDADEEGPGNSIVQAAYSAGLFSDREPKADEEEPAEENA